MDFGALPPEINSGRMYTGPGPATMLAASAGWESLAAELQTAASGYQSVVSSLADEAWLGPTSMSMAAAVAPYVSWMTITAEQCEQAATQATAAATAFDTAYAMTVPPPLIAANRAQLMALIATNFLGQNTPAIMATEAEYAEMWAQDAMTMYNYAATSASASMFSTFTSPPQTTNPGGLAGQAGAVAQTAGTQAGGNVQTMSTQLMSSVPQALQGLATPGSSSSAGLSQAAMGTGASLGSSGASAPISALSSLTSASSKTATKSASTGAGVVSGLTSSLTSVLGGSGATGLFDVVGIGSDAAGLGADGAGLGSDGAGLGFDGYGLSLDFAGAGSILGAEGVSGFPAPGELGDGLGSLGLGGVGGLGESASVGVGQASALGTLSVPPSWAEAVSSVTPLPALDANVMPGGWGAVPGSAPGAGISKLPLGGMVGRESDGTVQRIGFRSSLIPRSPVAG
ncbi:PPE family protein [Mycobacterium malmoense]|uniref:PPE family protein n=1 Tax=Mycobacterium malmoense TaxID=1780 RepID=A0ABX3SPR6_MYCMA|nr:PPE family protein [Mycobacterium malmoense]ORA79414.1 PPE family protein [Mycobacterium malmoense]QZA16763.1 PPE family protein [Mycobacterium malmoense]UNB93559.1 PPE family protein [Mycobacterium malmoense]